MKLEELSRDRIQHKLNHNLITQKTNHPDTAPATKAREENTKLFAICQSRGYKYIDIGGFLEVVA